MSITVHHLEYSRSLRILWLLEELGVDYTIRQWKRNKSFRAPKEAQDVHPLGRFPMVELDGTVLAESGAILEFFADREGKLRPTDGDALQQFRFFLHYAEGSAMPPLLVQLIVDKLRDAPVPFFIRPIVKGIADKVEAGYPKPEIARHFDFIDAELGKRDYFVGDSFSMADIQMFYTVEAGLSRGGGNRPNATAWLNRVKAREAYKRAVAKGGPAVPPQ